MFYSKAKKNAIEEYEKEFTRLQTDFDSLERFSKILNKERESAYEVIKRIEGLINSISNTPKEFVKELSEIEIISNRYEEEIDFAKNSKIQNMSIALAFGLVPAAAKFALKKAGVKLAVGVGTKALSIGVKTLGTVSGPVGWAASGIVTIAGVARNNKKTADKATVETIKTKKFRAELSKAFQSLMAVKSRLVSARDIARNKYKTLKQLRGCDYILISEEDKISLGTLVNEANALSKVLVEKPKGVNYVA